MINSKTYKLLRNGVYFLIFYTLSKEQKVNTKCFKTALVIKDLSIRYYYYTYSQPRRYLIFYQQRK